MNIIQKYEYIEQPMHELISRLREIEDDSSTVATLTTIISSVCPKRKRARIIKGITFALSQEENEDED